MNRILIVLALVIAVPLAGILSAGYGKRGFEREFQRDIERAAATQPDAAKLLERGLSFGEYCRDVSANNDAARDDDDVAACRSYSRTAWLKACSVLALLLGLGLLGGILYAAKAAAADRDKLLKFFGPGIRLVLFGVFALILLQGLVASYSIVVAEAALLHRVHWTAVLLILIGALFGALFMLREGLSVFKRVETEVVGIALFRKDQSLLWNFVERIAKRLGATPPKNIIVGLEPTCYVTNADVRVLPKGFPHREETLYLSLSLMRIFTLQELAAVIGHELGHFRGKDTRFSMEFYPVYAGSAKAISALSENLGDSFWQSLPLWPAISILSLFFDRFAVAESTIGRDRELEADKCGASVSSPMAIATSLLKLSAYAHLWPAIQAQLFEARNEGERPFRNASTEFAQRAAFSPRPNVMDQLADQGIPHPTDSHPPTLQRIQSLGLSFEVVKQQSLVVDPAATSAKLVAGIEVLEESLTALEAEMLHAGMGTEDDD